MICKNCGRQSDGKFCPDCGQQLETHRITLRHLLHEILHTFTHVEKGFIYTLKKLVTQPGQMQRLYLEGWRARHQKPFSMFFICASASALAMYWINKFAHGEMLLPEQDAVNYFFQHYYVLLHVALFPFYTLVTWLLFIKSGYNYAEILVLEMYLVAFMLLLLIPIQLFGALLPSVIPTRLIEITALSVYNIWTFVRFFNKTRWWVVIFLSIVNMAINYFVYVFIMEFIITQALIK